MKKINRFLIFSFILVVVSLPACNPFESADAPAATPTPTEDIVSVEVVDVAGGDIARFYTYAGTLQARQSIALMPQLSGQIDQVLVEVGDEVSEGDPLITIERDASLAEFRQAQASLRQAAAELSRLEEGSRPTEIAAAQANVQAARAQLNDVITIDDDERTAAAQALADARARLRRAQTEYDKIAWAGDVGTRPEALELEQATNAYEAALARYNLETTPGDAEVAPLMQQLAQAELQLDMALNPYRDVDFEVARAGVEQAEAALELAEIRLNDTTITAPFSGVISEITVEEGSTVTPQTSAGRLVSGEVEVAIDVEESRIEDINKGQPATLSLSAYPNTTFEGEVTEIDPTANPDSHTFEVTILPTTGQDRLRSGMYSEVSVLADRKQDVPLVPRSAIIEAGGQPAVYVIDEDNRARQQPVQLGLTSNNQVEILEGVQVGERVVIAGQRNLTDGAKVEIVSGLAER